MNTFEERLYSPLDTIWDFFQDSFFSDALVIYKQKMIDITCDETRYGSYLPGDTLREIFSSDENLSEFLGTLKEKGLQETIEMTKVVTFIISCEQIRRNIDNTPCSISEIFSQKILKIMEQLGQETYPPEDEVDEDERFYTYQNWLFQMDAFWFPIISEYWVPVHFIDNTEDPNIILVWSKQTGIVKYNKRWEIIVDITVSGTIPPKKREFPSYLRPVELSTEQ